MNVLIVGDAAREHAIVERLAEDSHVYAFLSKKNPGIARRAKKYWLGNPTDPLQIKNCVAEQKPDVAFVSPDALLAAGVSDVLAAHGVPVASPLKNAARIEWDKTFMRRLLLKYNIPGQVRHVVARTDAQIREALQDFKDVVVKPVGLTGGKGVKISGEHLPTLRDAFSYAQTWMKKDGVVLVEEKLEGEEFTLQAFSDGAHITVMPPVQDHKRVGIGDTGGNTGGMGSYSTGKNLPFLVSSDLEEATRILGATVTALAKEGAPFRGVLYGQFMAVADGVRVIEFNARFGDPEAINVLALLEDSLSETFAQMAEGRLRPRRFRTESTVVKYLVPNGYPEHPVKDQPLQVDENRLQELGVRGYYASVYENDHTIYCTSSRSMALLGEGTLEEAQQKAEQGCQAVQGPLFHRKDIGTAALIEKRVKHMRALRRRI